MNGMSNTIVLEVENVRNVQNEVIVAGNASFTSRSSDAFTTSSGTIDQVNNPKGTSFANWMVNVQGSPSLGNIPIMNGRETCTSVDNTKAERWVYSPDAFNAAVCGFIAGLK